MAIRRLAKVCVTFGCAAYTDYQAPEGRIARIRQTPSTTYGEQSLNLHARQLVVDRQNITGSGAFHQVREGTGRGWFESAAAGAAASALIRGLLPATWKDTYAHRRPQNWRSSHGITTGNLQNDAPHIHLSHHAGRHLSWLRFVNI